MEISPLVTAGLDAASNPVLLTDAGMAPLYANSAFRDWWKLPGTAVPQADAAAWFEAGLPALKGVAESQAESGLQPVQARSSDGAVFSVRARGQAVAAQNAQPGYWLFTFERQGAPEIPPEKAALLAQLPTPLIVYGLDGTGILWVNAAVTALLGYAQEDLRGVELTTLMKLPRADHVLLDTLAQLGLTNSAALTLRHKDGSGTRVMAHLQLGDLDGHPVGLASLRDLQEEERRKRDLDATQKLMRQAERVALLASWRYTPETHAFLASENLAPLHGVEDIHTLEEFAQALAPQDAERMLARLQGVLETGTPFDGEYSLGNPDGPHRHLRCMALLDESVEGERALLGLVQDVTEARQNTEALSARHNLLRAIVDAFPHPFYAKDTRGIYELVNERAKALAEPTVGTLLGKRLDDLVHISHEARAEMAEDDAKVLRTGLPQFVTRELAYADGQRRHFKTTKYPIKDDAGTVTGLVAFHEDVTAAVQAERTILDANRQLREILDAMPFTITVKDARGRFLVVNRAFAHLHGIEDKDWFLGKLPSDTPPISADGVEQVQNLDQMVLQTGRPMGLGRHGVVPPDGRRRVLRMDKAPLTDAQGNVDRVLTWCQDITDALEAEALQREFLQLLQSALDTIPFPISIKDANLRIQMVNRALEQAIGRSRVDLAGKPMSSFISEDFSQKADEMDQQVLATRQPALLKNGKFVGADGRAIHRRMGKYPLLNAEGELTGVVTWSEDITRQTLERDELAENRTLLRTLLDSMPHWINVRTVDGRYLLANKAMMEAENRPVSGFDDLVAGAGEPVQYFGEWTAVVNRQVAESGEPVLYTTVWDDSGGQSHKRLTSKSPLRDEQGNVVAILTWSEDQTPLVDAHRRLLNTNRMLRDLIDALPFWISTKNTEGTVQVVNEQMAQAHGMHVEEVEGMHADALRALPPAAPKELKDLETRVMETGRATPEFSFSVAAPDGTVRHRRGAKAPLRDAHDRVVGVLTWSTDVTEQVLSRQQLQESHKLLRDTLDALPFHITIKGADQRVKMANRSLTKSIGLDYAHVLGRTTREVLGDVPFAELTEHLESEVLHSAQPVQEGCFWEVLPDGSRIAERIGKHPLIDERGQVTGIVTWVEDITERRRVEHDLDENRRILRSIIDVLPYWIGVKDQDGRYLLVNKALASAHNSSVEAFIQRQTDETPELHPGGLAFMMALDAEVLRSTTPTPPREYTVHDAQGQPRLRLVRKFPLHGESGQVEGIVSFSEDITGQRRAADDLSDRQMRLQSIMDHTAEGIVIFDETGRIESVNHRATQLFGRPQARMEGANLAEMTTEKHREATQQMVQRLTAVPANEPLDIETLDGVGMRPDGSTFLFESNLGHMVINGQRLFIATLRDVTRQREMARQIEQHQRMESLGRLAGGIAHDLNNVLAPIMGYGELMLQDFPPPSEHGEYIRAILQSAQRGRDLVKQVLLFARSTSSRKEPITLDAVVREAVSLARAGANRIEVEEKLDKAAGVVIADPGQIHQVVMNLCINAVHAMPEGGRLQVMLDQVQVDNLPIVGGKALRGGFVRISVTDTGVGIPPEDQQRIFEPFFTTKTEGKGTGLGLSTVFGIVRGHGGGLTLRSNTGKGTAFEVYLPKVDSAPSANQVESSALPKGQEYVLVVDDNAAVAGVTRAVLSRNGYRVDMFSSAQEALAVIRGGKETVDLLLTDQSMPGMQGLELAELVRKEGFGFPVVVLTGRGHELAQRKQANIAAVLTKPVLPSELLRCVRETLDAGAAADA